MNLVKINSINIWDEEWEVGAIASSDGRKTEWAGAIRSSNKFQIDSNTEYYFIKGVTSRLVVFWYTDNQSYIGYNSLPSDQSVTSPNNARYVAICTFNDVGSVYNHDIQICLNSESQKTTYHPHWVLGLDGQGKAFTCDISSMLPSGIGCVDLGSLEWRMRESGLYQANIPNDDGEHTGSTQSASCACSKYRTEDGGNILGCARRGICLNPSYWSDSNVVVYDTNYPDLASFVNGMQGVLLFYRKASS